MIGKWMMTHNSKQWSVGIHAVAFQKNNRWHRTIKTTPYNVVYGQNPRADLTSLPVPFETLRNLNTEAELMNPLGHQSQEDLDRADDEDARELDDLPDYNCEEDVFHEEPGLTSNVRILPPQPENNEGNNYMLKIYSFFITFCLHFLLFSFAESSAICKIEPGRYFDSAE
jgi:hypothetical protein